MEAVDNLITALTKTASETSPSSVSGLGKCLSPIYPLVPVKEPFANYYSYFEHSGNIYLLGNNTPHNVAITEH